MHLPESISVQCENQFNNDVMKRLCRICGSVDVTLVKPANNGSHLEGKDFAITDHRYGVTQAIYRCQDCSFMQCDETLGTVGYYRMLEDQEYEAGRPLRLLQANAILKTIIQAIGSARQRSHLLDVGAGSGILVEAAARLGFVAEGIEPSKWLQAQAVANGCRVHEGVLPHTELSNSFDVVTIIDVIEHVDDPRALLRESVSVLKPSGFVAIVTPDTNSLMARLFGWRWWHYRIAHVGYFTQANLELACRLEGLKVMAVSRPGWFFSVAYLLTRLANYLPAWILPRERSWMHDLSIPLNLRDSLMIIAQREEG